MHKPFLAAALSFLATTVQAQESTVAGSGPGYVPSMSMNWTKRPGGQDVARLYPREALKLNRDGKIVVDCKIERAKLTDCRSSANPEGLGFEKAGLSFAKIFRAGANTKDGVDVEGKRVSIDIRLTIPPQ